MEHKFLSLKLSNSPWDKTNNKTKQSNILHSDEELRRKTKAGKGDRKHAGGV